jgi:cell division septation protein DedD
MTIALCFTAFAVALTAALPYVLDWVERVPSPVKDSGPSEAGARLAVPEATRPVSTAPRPGQAPVIRTVAPVPDRAVVRVTPMLPAHTHPRAPSPGGEMRPGEKTPHPGGTGSGGEAARGPGGHWVQLGVFKEIDNAERFARSLREHGFPVRVTSVTRTRSEGAATDTYHVVRAGAFSDQARAAAVRDDLKSRGYAGFLAEGAAR